MVKISNTEIKAKLKVINVGLDSINNSLLNVIRNISDLSGDNGLTGEKYNEIKMYFNTAYVATCYAFLRANDEFKQANDIACNNYDNAFNGECDFIDTDDLARKQQELDDLIKKIEELKTSNYETIKEYNEEEKREDVYSINTHKNDAQITSGEITKNELEKSINLINRIIDCDNNIKNIYSQTYVLYGRANAAEDNIKKIMYNQETFRFDYTHSSLKSFASLLQDENALSLAITTSIIGQDDKVMYMIWSAYSLTSDRKKFDTTNFELYISSDVLALINNDKEFFASLPDEIRSIDFSYETIRMLQDSGVTTFFANDSKGFTWSLNSNSEVYKKYFLGMLNHWCGGNWANRYNVYKWKNACTIFCAAGISYYTGFSIDEVDDIIHGNGGQWGINQRLDAQNGLTHFKSLSVNAQNQTIGTGADCHAITMDDIKVGMIIDFSGGHVAIVTGINEETGEITISENWSPTNPTEANPMCIHTYTVNCNDGDFSELFINSNGTATDFTYTDTIYYANGEVKTIDPNYSPEPLC